VSALLDELTRGPVEESDQSAADSTADEEDDDDSDNWSELDSAEVAGDQEEVGREVRYMQRGHMKKTACVALRR